VIDFQAASTIAAARAHVVSLRWRLLVWALFAVGAALVLNAWQAGLAWYLVLVVAAGFDALLGQSYLTTRSVSERNTAGVLFAWGCAFSAMAFAAMPLLLAANGGGFGQVLGVLMAASAFVRVMVFMSRARGLMAVVGTPAAIALIMMPFMPDHESPASSLEGALGVACGVLAFLAYVLRASLNNDAVIARLEAANKHARERQLEAEAKHAEAVEANRAKSEFLAVVTHELRTPLNAVIGYSEMIEEDAAAAGRVDLARDASRIERSARHLLALIDQVLQLTSADAGNDDLKPRSVDMQQMVAEIVAAMRDAAEQRGNRMAVRVSDDAQVAYTDGTKLAVCVSALLSNAIKFTENGLVAVSVSREAGERGDQLIIAVSDTGCGVAEADRERIFNAFTQLDATKTRTTGGMGLGLAVARRVARALGGELDASSQVGKGSTFTLRIPMRLGVASAASIAA